MTKTEATSLLREALDANGLNDWGIRISNDGNNKFLGMCLERDKTIILNGYHIELHPDEEIRDTIMHEIAHALVGCKEKHNLVWMAKATELGANASASCQHLDLPSNIIDAIRSGATVEIEYETVRVPKYKVTRLQDKCPDCGKVAKEKFSIDTVDSAGNIIKLITLECFHIIKKIIPKATPFDEVISNDWKPEIKNCKHVFPTKEEQVKLNIKPNECMKCHEFKLYAFQVSGARAAEVGLSTQHGFGIFDDMGLGKTPQSLVVVRFHPELTPTLYIVKSAIKFNWMKQIMRWIGPTHLPQIISTSRDFVFPGLKSYIISYDLLRRFPREKLQNLGIKLIVLDECQQIKNVDSARTQEVRKLCGMPNVKVLPLSGTPWKNRGEELFPVLNMIDPIKFHSQQYFLETWVSWYYEGNKKKQGGIKRPDKFREHCVGLMIRREFNEVIDEFPAINRQKVEIQLDQLAQETYDDEVSNFAKWYNEYILEGREASSIELLGKMARMRHLVGLAKISATIALAEEHLEETDRKLVIFVHHKDVLDSIYDELVRICEPEGVKVYKLTGDMNDGEKFTIQEKFNAGGRAFMVASTQAAGEGMDLQSCADGYMHERQWNPANEEQALPGRFRRIGQKSSVINSTYVQADGTIDEFIDILVERKRIQFHAVMNKGEVPPWNEGQFAKDLAEMIIRKHRQKAA